MTIHKPSLVAAGALVFSGSLVAFNRSPQAGAKLTFTPYHANGLYNQGETFGWTIKATGETSSDAKLKYSIKANNHTGIKSGEVQLVGATGKIEFSSPQPAMIYVTIEGEGKVGYTLAAAVAPTKLKPVLPRPADFDQFWKRKIDELHAVPINPVLTPKDGGRNDVEYGTIVMDHVNGGHIQGQYAKPKKPGKYPAIVQLQWASPPYRLWPDWITSNAAAGWLVINIEPHDVLPDGPPEYYKALPQALKNYNSIGWDDREKSYFVKMYQADYRAVDYVVNNPDWDGKTLVVMGTSMGGQQSLCVAGLHPKVTHVIVNEPAGCDNHAGLFGRQQGYPNFPTNNPKVMETSSYVDAINFASKIKATTLIAVGFTDTVAPPAGIWTAFNQVKGRKEMASMIDSPHNNTATPAQQMPWTLRSKAWLDALVKGEKAPVQN